MIWVAIALLVFGALGCLYGYVIMAGVPTSGSEGAATVIFIAGVIALVVAVIWLVDLSIKG